MQRAVVGLLCLFSVGACSRQDAHPATGDAAANTRGSDGSAGADAARGGGADADAGTAGTGGAGGASDRGGNGGMVQTGGRSIAAQGNGGAGGAGGTRSEGATGGAALLPDGATGRADAARIPSRSAGCSQSGQKTGELRMSTKDGTGAAREFHVLVPSGHGPTSPLAVTFAFHGAGGTWEDAKAFGIQGAANAASESIFVFPQGINYLTYGVGWNDRCTGYDMAFFDNMLATVEDTYCVDPDRVFVAGFSWGCDFVTALACCRGDRLRAVGAAACSDEFSNASDYTTYWNYPCPVTNTAAIRFTHDSSPNGDGAYSGTQFASTSRLYQAMNACSSNSVATAPSPCLAYEDCRHPFLECAYPGIGHAWPADWAAETWSFFSRAP